VARLEQAAGVEGAHVWRVSGPAHHAEGEQAGAEPAGMQSMRAAGRGWTGAEQASTCIQISCLREAFA
jgi:hypothetical protein